METADVQARKVWITVELSIEQRAPVRRGGKPTYWVMMSPRLYSDRPAPKLWEGLYHKVWHGMYASHEEAEQAIAQLCKRPIFPTRAVKDRSL